MSKLKIDDYKDKFVHSHEGDIVGKLDSIKDHNLVIKKEIMD